MQPEPSWTIGGPPSSDRYWPTYRPAYRLGEKQDVGVLASGRCDGDLAGERNPDG